MRKGQKFLNETNSDAAWLFIEKVLDMVGNNPKGCKNRSLNCRFLYGGRRTATPAVKKNSIYCSLFSL
jgi:hypothetical protein